MGNYVTAIPGELRDRGHLLCGSFGNLVAAPFLRSKAGNKRSGLDTEGRCSTSNGSESGSTNPTLERRVDSIVVGSRPQPGLGRSLTSKPASMSRPLAIRTIVSRRRLRCPRSTLPNCVQCMPHLRAAASWLRPSSDRRWRIRSPNASVVGLRADRMSSGSGTVDGLRSWFDSRLPTRQPACVRRRWTDRRFAVASTAHQSSCLSQRQSQNQRCAKTGTAPHVGAPVSDGSRI